MLILPLLGGYIFVRFFNHTKIHILRSDKDRLIIRASIAGLCALILAYSANILFSWLFPCSNWGVCISSLWRENIPFEYSDISFLSLIIGAVAWYPLNFIYSEQYEIDRAIKEDADPLELLLKRAQDETLAVMVTMTNHKVYIGNITHQFNPATPTSYIGLFPLKSGYRDAATKEMHLTTNYSVTYKKIGKEIDRIATILPELEKMPIEELDALLKTGHPDYMQLVEMWEKLEHKISLFELVIPTNQIAAISFYDDEVHKKYFLPSPQTK